MCCVGFSDIIGKMWFLTTGPLLCISVFFAEFFLATLQACPRGFVPSRRAQDRARIPWLPRLFCSPLAVITVAWFLDTRMVSNSAKFRSFLISMCIDAPESATNYLSSGFVEDGSDNDQTS